MSFLCIIHLISFAVLVQVAVRHYNTLNPDVPSLKYDTIDFIKPSEVKNLKITGTPSIKDKISASGIFTNVVFTGDMSSITNKSFLNGVIEFKDNPMM